MTTLIQAMPVKPKKTKEVAEVPDKKVEKVKAAKPSPPNVREHPAQIDINNRFFTAMDYLVENELLTVYRFCKSNNLRKPAYYYFRRNIDKYPVPSAMLSYLVKDGNISAHWLLTGEGDMIRF